MEDLNHILSLIRGHNNYMRYRVDLIASNSYTSNFCRIAMVSNLMNNYCIGLPGDRLYGGCAFIDMIEREVYSLVKRLFGMEHAIVQFLSGMQANIGAYHAVLEKGDTVISALTKHGGHYSHTSNGPLRFFSANVLPVPFDDDTYNIDLEKLEKLVATEKPKLLILGWSEFLFPHPLKEVRKICDDHDVILMYDMSHVVGLIAGKTFQPDVAKYADIITSSTGKSMHSADHGMVIFNKDTFKPKLLEAVMPLLTSNTHPQEVASLGVALAELLYYGEDYAKQVVANTKALGKALEKEGIKVLYPELGYSESHTLLVEYKESAKAVKLLDRAGILINGCELPWDPDGIATGLRIGTQVITRHGMKEKDMEVIANAISQVLISKKLPEIVYNTNFRTWLADKQQTSFSFDDEFPAPYGWMEDLFKTYKAETVSTVLRSSLAFANCSLEEIDSVQGLFTFQDVSKGEVIFEAGSESDSVYFIAHGDIEIYDQSNVNQEVIIKLDEGAHFGELGVISGNRRAFGSRAGNDTSLLKIQADDFLNMLKNVVAVRTHFDKYILSLEVS